MVSIKTSNPTKNMIKDVMRLAKSSIFQWPKRWSRSAGFLAIRRPIKTAILATISDTLLKPSAIRLEDWSVEPAIILTAERIR